MSHSSFLFFEDLKRNPWHLWAYVTPEGEVSQGTHRFFAEVLLFILLYKPINQSPRNAKASGDIGDFIRTEPPCICNFIFVDLYFTALMFSSKGQHVGIGKGPGLTAQKSSRDGSFCLYTQLQAKRHR